VNVCVVMVEMQGLLILPFFDVDQRKMMISSARKSKAEEWPQSIAALFLAKAYLGPVSFFSLFVPLVQLRFILF
jgi:hypothetical protein